MSDEQIHEPEPAERELADDDLPEPTEAAATAADESAFAGDTPPHVPDEGAEPPSDEALDTTELGEGGPAGA